MPNREAADRRRSHESAIVIVQPVLLYHSHDGRAAPAFVRDFAREHGMKLVRPTSLEELAGLLHRTLPACVILTDDEAGIELCRTLKRDALMAIIPVIFHLNHARTSTVFSLLEAGADEVLTAAMKPRECRLRIRVTLERADRDVGVHPTTRLPGPAQIERDIAERLRRGETFAVCYADLDYFKEFNDRYGYHHGDRVIYLTSQILRDVVRAMAPGGFVGHIGGDDFIFNVPAHTMPAICEEILQTFDELIPYQYREEDRRMGHFVGSDRRGNTFRVPIMTLSIGVVTNVRRKFSHTARISELATEMKAYAKTLPGSVYAVDRRADLPESVQRIELTVDQPLGGAVTEPAT